MLSKMLFCTLWLLPGASQSFKMRRGSNNYNNGNLAFSSNAAIGPI